MPSRFAPWTLTQAHSLVSTFVQSARDVLEGRDIVMLSDGRPTRTYCYVADAIVGYYTVLEKGRPGESYNVGTETPEISMMPTLSRPAFTSARMALAFNLFCLDA